MPSWAGFIVYMVMNSIVGVAVVLAALQIIGEPLAGIFVIGFCAGAVLFIASHNPPPWADVNKEP